MGHRLLHDILAEFAVSFRGKVNWVRSPQLGKLLLARVVLQADGAAHTHDLVLRDSLAMREVIQPRVNLGQQDAHLSGVALCAEVGEVELVAAASSLHLPRQGGEYDLVAVAGRPE